MAETLFLGIFRIKTVDKKWFNFVGCSFSLLTRGGAALLMMLFGH